MKKKILITMPSLFLGGAERSLLGLLENIDYSKVEVFLFLFRKEGELLREIPSEVKVLDEIPAYTTFDRPIVEVLKSVLFPYAMARMLSKIILNIKCKLNKCSKGVWTSMQYTAKYLNPILPKIPGQYDLAISFLGIPLYMNKIVAKKKMAWIHTDYSMLFPDTAIDRKAFKLVDRVVTVSEQCEQSFLQIYPELKSKSLVVENILSKEIIEKKADEEKIELCGKVKLLSIGRFCYAKNFDNIPEICSFIIQKGLDVKWYIIGFGGDEKQIFDRIKEFGMGERVIILGKKSNPYPYIKACDVYIQPSRYEGKAVSVREAQILDKPVVITNYATAKDQVESGVDGMIIPLENQLCAQRIIEIVSDTELLEKLSRNTQKNDYTNKQELEKIYKIMES